MKCTGKTTDCLFRILKSQTVGLEHEVTYTPFWFQIAKWMGREGETFRRECSESVKGWSLLSWKWSRKYSEDERCRDKLSSCHVALTSLFLTWWDGVTLGGSPAWFQAGVWLLPFPPQPSEATPGEDFPQQQTGLWAGLHCRFLRLLNPHCLFLSHHQTLSEPKTEENSGMDSGTSALRSFPAVSDRRSHTDPGQTLFSRHPFLSLEPRVALCFKTSGRFPGRAAPDLSGRPQMLPLDLAKIRPRGFHGVSSCRDSCFRAAVSPLPPLLPQPGSCLSEREWSLCPWWIPSLQWYCIQRREAQL